MRSKRHSAMTPVLAMLLASSHVHGIAASPPVNIADVPLFDGRMNVHSNLLLSLSVEFPTVGVAYRGDGGTYNRTVEYVGYFNSAKCYRYNGSERNPGNDPDAFHAGLYFQIEKDADALRECDGTTFSGNFMNWAASSAIDMLRLSLTGGDRILDKPGETILQRAVLSDTPDANFYAHATYFPRREVREGGNVSAPNRVTPFNVKKLYVVSCRNRILFSDVSSGSISGSEASQYCTSQWNGSGKMPVHATDKKLGDYLVRVAVCDANEGPVRKELCLKYGNGYKPVGQIQRNADRLRIGAMGYLLDDAAQRYGGVLRAPIRYVGARQRKPPSFAEAANERPEWDEATGVFHHNPENSVTTGGAPNSGVVNYLNKFGRKGRYKQYDPVGELFYEGIRYFQGKAPTEAAISGATESMKDGFPLFGKWEDPVVASCQRNYILSIADVNTHWDRHVPGNTRTKFGPAGNQADAYDAARPADTEVAGKTPAFDVTTWTRLIGDMETDVSGSFGNPAKNGNLAGLDTRDSGASGHGTYYMAGLAYWANTSDIRLDKPVRVKTFAIDVDEGGNGLIDGSNRILKPRDSQLYLAAKYGGFDARTSQNNPFISLSPTGTPVAGSYAEWSDGTGPSAIPRNYFLAGQPAEMMKSIGKVFASIADGSGTIAGVSASTTKISSDGAFVYQPGFESDSWGGSLKKLKITLDAEENVNIAKSPEWDAGQILTGTDQHGPKPAHADRRIFTSQFGPNGAMSTVEFKWDLLNATQQALLDVSPVDGKQDGKGAARVNYLRGDRTRESDRPDGFFRTRRRVLGDILNSNPVFVGAPSPSHYGNGYEAFAKNHQQRAKAVYVGANDGMLHAFAASDGTELFAFVPNAILMHLNRLASPDYKHRPYVDGGITVAEAQLGGSWKTVLASGMGGGAQGIFALDVTDPANFAAGGKALLEFSDADDPDMGNILGAPVIAKFNTGMQSGSPQFKYFVVVSSGVNNYREDGANRFNTDGANALFLLSLDKPASAKWQSGINYFKFRMPSKAPSLQNGLSTPALVTGTDGSVRYAYAGDLQGNLWRFNFTGAAPWGDALSGGEPIFSATDEAGVPQPITVQPRVVFAPGGGFIVLFGTGKFMEQDDAVSGTYSVQSFYGVLDPGSPQSSTFRRNDLSVRTLSKASHGGFKIAGPEINYGTGTDQKKGWYFDFADSDTSGERNITNPLVINGFVFFNTLIPGTDPCQTGGGRSYVLDTLSGTAAGGETGRLSAIGMLSPPVPFETGVEVGDRNPVGRRTVKKRYGVVNFGTGGTSPGSGGMFKGGDAAVGDKVDTLLPAGRFSWREIINWEEVRNAMFKK
ncbi:pilus assembly protein [Noviherbaspirillum aerium]|uniref:pilus assembly protein n=1 Tax=Noviherbaspirillum aerium TaxID=2588497 RepID=UPI00124EA70C|nr:PilC/PilY family type IV pilus protein [Noviherbaspirillum aerium]